jgi:uncharacterized protein YndB with AHSA1/START domain
VAVIENSVLIRRPIEDVFEYLADLRNELTWNPQCRSMEKVTEGPVGLGTKFRAKWKQSPLIQVECTAFDRPRSWQYTNGGPIAVVIDLSLTTEEDGTRLDTRFDAHPTGLMRLFFPIVLRSLRRAEKANMQYLKRALEGSSVTA